MPFTSNPDQIEVSPEDTANALGDGSAQVVDVREQDEWDEGRIEGTIHIPMDRLSTERDKVSRDRPVIFHCRVGGRSLMAAQAYRGAGYDAYSMAGGIQLWDDQRRPMIPDGATVADH
jgi:hydroxyacylglutathione hydrolase/adenylyltransferase/sulfurtransferase